MISTEECGIIFSGEMVKAILGGRKTQTRRVVRKPQPDLVDAKPRHMPNEWAFWHDKHYPNGRITRCPYGVPGDRLYVRETWNVYRGYAQKTEIVWHRAHWSGGMPHPSNIDKKRPFKWRPSIHMPKWAARIWLKLTGVRVERIQDISAKDALAEGICKRPRSTPYPWSVYICEDFHGLWDSLNKKRGYGWDKNPWVWVLEFEKEKP